VSSSEPSAASCFRPPGLKPVARVVVARHCWDEADLERARAHFVGGEACRADRRRSADADESTLCLFENVTQWGTEVWYVCRDPSATLGALFDARRDDPLAADLELPRAIRERRVDAYLARPGGFDAADGQTTWLECALLYGYPLDVAHARRPEVFHF